MKYINTLVIPLFLVSACADAQRLEPWQLFEIDQFDMVGRSTAGTGDQETLTPTEVRSIINVEDGAAADQDWGEIGGTLSNQTDLQGALDAKSDGTHDHPHSDLTGIATDDHHTPTVDTNASTICTGATEVLQGDGSCAIPSGINDHGSLSGLADDDHTQYVPVDGSRGVDSTAGFDIELGDSGGLSAFTVSDSLGDTKLQVLSNGPVNISNNLEVEGQIYTDTISESTRRCRCNH